MGILYLFLGFWAFAALMYLLMCIMVAIPNNSSYSSFISRLNESIVSFGKAYNESMDKEQNIQSSDDPAMNAFFGYLIVLPAYLPFVVIYYLIIAPIILLVEFINDRL